MAMHTCSVAINYVMLGQKEEWQPVLLLKPNYRLAHLDKCLFYHLKTYFLDQTILKILNFNLKTAALVATSCSSAHQDVIMLHNVVTVVN